MPKREYFIDQRGDVVYMRNDTPTKSCSECAYSKYRSTCHDIIPVEHRLGESSMDMVCITTNQHYVKQ